MRPRRDRNPEESAAMIAQRSRIMGSPRGCRPRPENVNRHHGKVAAKLQDQADLMGEGRLPPPRSGTVGIAKSQPKGDAGGTIHRSGCACGELHANEEPPAARRLPTST